MTPSAPDLRLDHSRCRLWVLLLLIGLILNPVALPGEIRPSASLSKWSVFKDVTGSQTIESLAKEDFSLFEPLPYAGIFSAGFSRSVFWLRFEVAALPDTEWLLDILPPYLDDLRLYTPLPNTLGQFVERRAGDHLPFAAREVPYRGFSFSVRQTGPQPQICYLRLQTTSSVHIVLRLWSPESFFAAAQWENGLIFAGLSVLLTILVLNLNNSFWLTDPLLPWLCAYIGSLLLMFSGVFGVVTPFLPVGFPQANDLWIGLSNLAVMAFSSGFHRRLFGVVQERHLTFGIYQAGFWLPWLGVPAVVFGRYPELMSTLFSFYLILTLIGLGLAVHLWRRREAGAKLTFLATIAGLTGTLLIILNVQGMVQGKLLSLHSMLLASLIQVLALHLAVGARFQRLQLEKQREQERAILAMAEARREREARTEQSGLFAMISHEIKNPLAIIGGAVQTLQALVDETPEIERRYDRIRRAIERINALVEKTLEYDQVMTGLQGDENWRSFDTGQLVANIVNDYDLPPTRLYLAKGDPCFIQAHMGLVGILVSNLLDNALKYSPESSQVRIKVHRVGSDCRLDVSDEGPGIPAELRPTLFNRYVRGKEVGHVTGAGLGLFLVARIAEWHDGKVECLDSNTGGARFIVDFPCDQPRTSTLISALS